MSVPRWALLTGATVAALVPMAFGGGMALGAAIAAPSQISCDPGVSIEVKPDHSWQCLVAPSPSPSASVSASPSSSPSASPSPSISPSPSVSPSKSPSPSPSVSSTQSPSPSPSATGPQLNCLHQLAACGFPSAATTGVQPGVTLTTVGDVTLGTTGQVFENRLVTGCINVTAANVTIRNVKVTGDCFYSIDTARGPAYDGGTTTIEHVEISCPNGHTAIGEKHVSVRWANIHGCENGFDMDGNFVIADSWIHDLLQSDVAHSDGIQTTHGSSSIVVTHNVVDASGITTSAMITDPNNGTTGVTLANNLLAGGAYTLYCRNNSTGWSVTGNRFVMGAYGYLDECGAVPVWSGNIDDVTGATIPRTL